MDFASLIDSRSESAADLLVRLIAFRSTVGSESEIQEYLARYVREAGFEASLVPIHPGIESDEDYTTVPGHKGYEGRANLIVTVPGAGGGRSVIFNTHVDVVPGPDELFTPRVENGVVYGRGACDAKGNVVAILLALEALKSAGVRLRGDVIVQFVIEEESGGNGTLSAIIDGGPADGVVIVESSDMRVHPASRGAVWFKLAIEGKSTHMGWWRDGVSAVDEMIDVIRILRDYERGLVEESRGDPLFPDPASNIRVNVGTIQGGDWPSTVPAECTVEGGIGFLPNKRLADIRDEVRREIETHCSPWTREHYSLTFDRLHNEAYGIPGDHPLVRALSSCVESALGSCEVTGFPASSDARLFHHRAHLPIVVFGPGDTSYAHSLDEQMSVKDITLGAKILADFLIQWCGT